MLKLTPDEKAYTLENLGLLYIRNGEWERAMNHTNKVLTINPQLAWSWLMRAIAASKLGRKEIEVKSVKAWEKHREQEDGAELRKYIPIQFDEFFAK